MNSESFKNSCRPDHDCTKRLIGKIKKKVKLSSSNIMECHCIQAKAKINKARCLRNRIAVYIKRIDVYIEQRNK
ncbi:hypothetical protein BpHYR1_032442 [Brachionus plicatilis]|uniref:Uncharacterized protein n=1 Tax=Brachionus plicatilis TaxID=10195 RepID=A0A3M7PM56_BRAPC|nr:hypothetical protein BpHYR1_032442 [Brachionus plicatilis]